MCVTDFGMFTYAIYVCTVVFVGSRNIIVLVLLTLMLIAHLRFTQSIVSIVTHFDVDGPCCLHGYFQDDFCWFFLVVVDVAACAQDQVLIILTVHIDIRMYECWLATNNAKCACAILPKNS